MTKVEKGEGWTICKCTNCQSHLYDENPQTDANEYTEISAIDMELLYEDDGSNYWGCPNCKTDEFLIDC